MGCAASKKEQPQAPTKRPINEEHKLEAEMEKKKSIAAAAAQSLLRTMDTMQFAHNAFAVKMFTTTTHAETAVISPVSFGIVLCMMMEGAGGSTEEEIVHLLGGNVVDSEGVAAFYKTLGVALTNASKAVVFHSVNALFVDKSIDINNDYQKMLKDTHNAMMLNVDFSDGTTAEYIMNDLICEQTQGALKEIVTDRAFSTFGTVVLNANVFEAEWFDHFDSGAPEPLPFHGILGDREVSFASLIWFTKEEFMTNERTSYLFSTSAECTTVQLTYQDPAFSALLLMPNGDFAQWRASMSVDTINRARATLKVKEKPTDLLIPMVCIEYKLDGEKALKELGVDSCFGAKADFSGISNDAPLFIESIHQKATIEWNVQGTKAAAASWSVMCMGGREDDTITIFDHPFVFVIFHENTILYMANYV